ncbi:hypothetical protein GCM10009623_22020 [Nocardioides aestuarii]|uniref:Uncharacterized protein n=1 Tax=Nocardioides aestuarii TaxID=252231 RepID=A0ABW4TQL9_9ACTN
MTASLDLFWIPLGAGGHVVHFNGLVYEAIVARRQHRARRALFHAALVAELPEGRTTIEVGPAWNRIDGSLDHGAVVTGPVGLQPLGRWRWFRYEIRCWPDGVIPDLAYAVGGPQRLTDDESVVRRALGAACEVPILTWGRDELRIGEMWNSNSVIAWILARAGVDPAELRPPGDGRAPGWDAGIAALNPTSR